MCSIRAAMLLAVIFGSPHRFLVIASLIIRSIFLFLLAELTIIRAAVTHRKKVIKRQTAIMITSND